MFVARECPLKYGSQIFLNKERRIPGAYGLTIEAGCIVSVAGDIRCKDNCWFVPILTSNEQQQDFLLIPKLSKFVINKEKGAIEVFSPQDSSPLF